MALVAHTMVGPYKILSLLGAGGMGEVDSARDERLDNRAAMEFLTSRQSGCF
jgi:serine/threonine protein kinase